MHIAGEVLRQGRDGSLRTPVDGCSANGVFPGKLPQSEPQPRRIERRNPEYAVAARCAARAAGQPYPAALRGVRQRPVYKLHKLRVARGKGKEGHRCILPPKHLTTAGVQPGSMGTDW